MSNRAAPVQALPREGAALHTNPQPCPLDADAKRPYVAQPTHPQAHTYPLRHRPRKDMCMIRKSGKYFADWYDEAGRREQRVARHGCEETGSGLVAGTWIATAAPLIIEPGSVIDFTGTFNSTSSPLSIPPSVSVERQRGASSQTNFSLMGNASVMNWSCVTSLTLSGQAIGTHSASRTR